MNLRVIDGLPHPHQQVKYVSVIVQQRPFLHVAVKLCATLRIKGRIEIFLGGVKLNVLDIDNTRRKDEILGSRGLGPAHQKFVKHVMLQLEHGPLPIQFVTASLDRIQNVLVKVSVVLHGSVPAILTDAVDHAIVQGRAVACAPVGVFVKGMEMESGK